MSLIKRKICKEEGCKSLVWRNGKCKFHQEGKLTLRKPIKPVSTYHQETLSLYRPKRLLFLNKHRFCALMLDGCTGKATCIEHTKGKATRELYLDESLWLPSCINCNRNVELLGEERYIRIKKHRHWNDG